jgi:hypothetical protein
LKVRAGGKEQVVSAAEQLPAGPFAVHLVSFLRAPGADKVDDAGLGHLKALTTLRPPYLNQTRAGDARLAHLKALTDLEMLTARSLLARRPPGAA